MIVSGVTFIDDSVKGMTKEEFIDRHIDVFWTDKDKKARKKILSDTYDMICGTDKEGVKE